MFSKEYDNNFRGGRTLQRDQFDTLKQASIHPDNQQDLRTRRTTAKMAQLLQPSSSYSQQSPSQARLLKPWGKNVELNNSGGQSKNSSQNILIPVIKDLNQERMVQRMKSRTIHSDNSASKLDNAIIQADSNITLLQQRLWDGSPSNQSGNQILNERINSHLASTIPGGPATQQIQTRSQSRERELLQSTNLNCLQNEWSKMKKDHNFDNRSQSPFKFQPPLVNHNNSSMKDSSFHLSSIERMASKEAANSQERLQEKIVIFIQKFELTSFTKTRVDSHWKQDDYSQKDPPFRVIAPESKTQQKTLIKKSVPLSKINLELIKNDSFSSRQLTAGRKTPKSASSTGSAKVQVLSSSAQKPSTLNSATNTYSSSQLSNRQNKSKERQEEPHFQTIIEKYSNIHKKQSSNQINLSQSQISNSAENSFATAAGTNQTNSIARNSFEIPCTQSSSQNPQSSTIQFSQQQQTLQSQIQQQINQYPSYPQFSQQQQPPFQFCSPSNPMSQAFLNEYSSTNKSPQEYPSLHKPQYSPPSNNVPPQAGQETTTFTNMNNEQFSQGSQYYNFSSKAIIDNPNNYSSQLSTQPIPLTQHVHPAAILNTPNRQRPQLPSQPISNQVGIKKIGGISRVADSSNTSSNSRIHNAVKIMSPKTNDLKVISNKNNSQINNNNSSYGSNSILSETANHHVSSDSIQISNSFSQDPLSQTQHNLNNSIVRVIQNNSTNNCKERDVKQLIMSKIHKMNVAKIFLKEDEITQNSSSASAGDASTSMSTSERTDVDFTRAHSSLIGQNSPISMLAQEFQGQMCSNYPDQQPYNNNSLNCSNTSFDRQPVTSLHPSRFDQTYNQQIPSQLKKQSSSSNLQDNNNTSSSNMQINRNCNNNPATVMMQNEADRSQNRQFFTPFNSSEHSSQQYPQIITRQLKESQLIFPNPSQEKHIPLQSISQNHQSFQINTLPTIKNEALSSSQVYSRINHPQQTNLIVNYNQIANNSGIYENCSQMNFPSEVQKIQQKVLDQQTSFQCQIANQPSKNFVLQPQAEQTNMTNSTSFTYKKTFPLQERPFLRSNSQENQNQFAYSQNQNILSQQPTPQAISFANRNNNTSANYQSVNTGQHAIKTQQLFNSSVSISGNTQQTQPQQKIIQQVQPQVNSFKVSERIESNWQLGSQNSQISKLSSFSSNSIQQTCLGSRQPDSSSRLQVQVTTQIQGDYQSKLKKTGQFFVS